MKNLPILLLASSSLFAGTTSAQTQKTSVILIGTGSTNRKADPAVQKYLEERFGAANVTFQRSNPSGTVTASTILGFDVAVISSTVSSGHLKGGGINNSPTPIVNMEPALAQNTTGEFRITGSTNENEAAHKITILAAHPITAGFGVGSTVQISAPGSAEVWWSTGAQAQGAVSLAHDDDTRSNKYLTYIEKGGVLLNGGKAPARQVMFGTTNSSFNSFTPEGKLLFGQAVCWASGGCCASQGNYGTGLAGKSGIPTLTTSALPLMGTSFNLMASNSSGVATTGLILVGQQNLSLGFLGGTLLVTPVLQSSVPLGPLGVSIPIQVPDLSVLCGVSPKNLVFYAQVLQLDAAAALGVSFTPGLQLNIGK